MRSFGRIPPEEAEAIWSNSEFRQIIEGHLLGDAVLITKDGRLFSNTCQSYVEHTQQKIKELTGKPCTITHHPALTTHRPNGDTWYQPIDSVACCCKHIFMPQRKRWYPDGIKIVPKDVFLTPIMTYKWHCDGCLSISRKKLNLYGNILY